MFDFGLFVSDDEQHQSPSIHPSTHTTLRTNHLAEELNDDRADAQALEALVLPPEGDVALEGQELEEQVEDGGEDGDGCRRLCVVWGGGWGSCCEWREQGRSFECRADRSQSFG